MMYTAAAAEALFTQSDIPDQSGVAGYTTKTIKSGRILEAESYPRYTRRMGLSTRKPKPEAVEMVNERNSWKRMRRMVEANFTDGDYWVTLTYAVGQSVTRDQAMRDIRNYIARVQRRRAKLGLQKTRYLYVIEWGETKGRIHHHIIMQRMEYDTVHALWGMGRTDVKALQADEKRGYEECTRYMCKQARTKGEDGTRRKQKKWVASKGMKQPDETTNRTKLSRRAVQKIAVMMRENGEEARKIYEKAYPGYKFVGVEVRISEYVPGAYIYATMYKEESGYGGKRGARAA